MMKSRKMPHLRNCSTIRGIKDIKKMSSLSLTSEEHNHLNNIVDKKAIAEHEKRERARFEHQEKAKIEYKKNYYKARERLAAIINKNRILMELRNELQYNRKAAHNISGDIRNE